MPRKSNLKMVNDIEVLRPGIWNWKKYTLDTIRKSKLPKETDKLGL